jgi:putative transposase
MSEPVRPFERAHVDHTEMDVESIFSETAENLGRAWLTVMIDHYSRRILGFFISYEPPSYRAVLMTLRDCVRRYGRLPTTIVVDGGKEFRSIWFEVVCAFFGITVLRRPPRKARFGAQIERFFGTENSVLLHTLTGNTQLRKNVRQMTPAVDPSKVAIWDLASLYELHEKYLFEQYDTTEHLGILMQPRQAFNKGMQSFGARPERLIRYDQAFLILTCPSTDKGTARVQPDGVKVNYFYFNAPALHAYLGKDVPVRYEPFDLGTAYAYVGGRWITLHSRFERQLRGLTERELEIICTEYKKRYGDIARRRLSDTQLAKFLEEVEKTESLLLERKRALELKKVLSVAGTGAPSPESDAAPAAPPVPEGAAPAPVEQDEEAIELNEMEIY